MAVDAGEAGVSPPEPQSYTDEIVEDMEEAARAGQAAIAARGELPADRFLDREASWLDFNARVLELAEDPDVPLLERVRFLSIFANNLDEFFMVRVAGLRRRIATGIAVNAPSGLSPREQLDVISVRAHELVEQHARLFETELLPALAKEKVEILRWDALGDDEQDRLHSLFRDRVYPVLTPLAVDPAHPFPYISGLSLNLAVVVRDDPTGKEHFARVKVPPSLPRFVPVDDAGRFVPLEDVIAAHLPQLFGGLSVLETYCFRVTRNEDLQVEEEEDVENLLKALERELSRRRFGSPVRLEVEDGMSDRVLDLLRRELGVGDADIYRLPGPLDLAGLFDIADLDRPELKYPAFVPATPTRLQDPEVQGVADIFAALDEGDLLVHHPYDSFSTSVQALLEQAAADPAVLAIKQTLYRTSGDSPIVDALIDAAESGKQVLVLVEIKARFDEQANIRWARQLEQAGCHVVYGLVGLKTHCKTCLVVRQDPDGTLRRYSHIGTGNYNPKTARIYEDLGLLTADPAVGADLTDLFNHLSGYTRHKDYRRLLVAPDTLRRSLVERIGAAAAAARKGERAEITLKLNSLVDEDVIDALYDASRAGVKVDLIVRGMCALRPGVKRLSKNIRVRSILGRFLEHSRVLRFRIGGDEQLWIGSADVMHRNLDRRVEALVCVTDVDARRELCAILDFAMSDQISSWHLSGDGTWHRQEASSETPLRDYQQELIERKRRQVAAATG